MEKFLNQGSVRKALGVGDIEFVSCSSTVYQAMLVDWMRNLEVGIPALLEDGISLLVYAGEYDLICNWLGMLPYLISVWKYFKMSYLGRTFMVCIDEFSPDV
jgi:carboxypeptidase C (cathepsin A)